MSLLFPSNLVFSFSHIYLAKYKLGCIPLSCFGDACEISISNEMHSCSSYTFNSTAGAQTYWTINGEYYNSGAGIDFDPTEAGTYTICGGFETPECPMGSEACETVTIDADCF